jgi:hypothetical protein
VRAVTQETAHVAGSNLTEGIDQMSKLNKTGLAREIVNELELMHATAAQAGGLRYLQDLELSWVAGGDATPTYDTNTPPSP